MGRRRRWDGDECDLIGDAGGGGGVTSYIYVALALSIRLYPPRRASDVPPPSPSPRTDKTGRFFAVDEIIMKKINIFYVIASALEGRRRPPPRSWRVTRATAIGVNVQRSRRRVFFFSVFSGFFFCFFSPAADGKDVARTGARLLSPARARYNR